MAAAGKGDEHSGFTPSSAVFPASPCQCQHECHKCHYRVMIPGRCGPGGRQEEGHKWLSWS